MNRTAHGLLAGVCLVGSGAVGFAQEGFDRTHPGGGGSEPIAVTVTPSPACKADNVKVEFSHRGSADIYFSRRVELSDKEKFTICVRDTYPSAFEYTLHELKDTSPRVGGAEGGEIVLETKEIQKVHDAQFGGYLLYVRKKPAAQLPDAIKDLPEVTAAIFVVTQGWEIESSGAFTGSSLVDRKYYVKGEGDAATIVRDEAAEDAARLGVAAFVHVFLSSRPKWATVSFGLGINETGRTTYYLGTGYRFGNRLTLTGGLALGSVSDISSAGAKPPLPAELPRRNAFGGFVAVSYSFLGGGVEESLKKPFAPTPAPAKPVNTPPTNGK